MYSMYGRDDLGGLLSVSQILMDRYADYEAMEEYPDIGCLAEGTLVYVVTDTGIVKPVPIEVIAVEGEGITILGFDVNRKRIVKIQANNPRLTSPSMDVVAVKMSNGRTIKATPDHLFLTADGWAAADPSKVKDGVKAAKLVKGAILIGMFAGFNPTGLTALVEPRWGKLEVLEDPTPAGKAKVYDITTVTHNFIAEGTCVHNSAYRYFANDAVQPSVTDGRVIWTVSDDDAIRGMTDDLMHKRLRAEYELWSQAYTAGMYGNNFEELLINGSGVVGLNHLPVPTMRRVEGLDGSLIGYVQDITGQFTANSHELRAMLAGNVEIPKSLALFEDWQVVHFRMRATRRRSPYGVGVGEGARWVWKRLIMMEDASIIYWLNRVPRYAFYVDVTDVPPDRVEGFLKKMKRDLKKKKMVNPATGRLDMRYKPLCLSALTKIPQLDGTERTVREMADAFARGEEQWVYSTDVEKQGRILPGKVKWAGKTRENAELLKLTLDNGESIKVTPDHKMIRRNGDFAEAQTLKVGDSLMPFRRGISTPEKGYAIHGYEWVYDPSVKLSRYTHRIVAGELGIRKPGPQDTVTHHKDFNKLNNDPRNLEEMDRTAHRELHQLAGHTGGKAVAELRKVDSELDRKLREASTRNITAFNKDPKKRARTSEQNRERDSAQYIRAYNASEKHEADNETRRRNMKAFWRDKERSAASAIKRRLVFSDEFVQAIRRLIEELPDAGAERLAKLANERGLDKVLQAANARRIKRIHADMLVKMVRKLGYKTLAEFKGVVVCDNHKVVAIEWLVEREDTYTLTVEPAHTFGISAGIFVKNSQDEDFIVGVREGRDLARIEVVSAPEWTNNESLDYFKRMLHGTLNVPRAWLGQEEPLPSKNPLSSEDVRAARVTLNLQQELKLGYERICRVHLAARGMKNPDDADFSIQMTVPSGIYELAAYEVLNARADYATRIAPFTSVRWVLENILKMGEAEIAAIEKQRKKEQQEGMGAPGGMGGGMGMPPAPMPPPPPSGGGSEQPPAESPGTAGTPEPPPPGAPAREWKVYDQGRRIEEMRYRESCRNHQFLVDKLGQVLSNQDDAFSHRERERRAFFEDFKKATINSRRGFTTATPSGRGRGTANGSLPALGNGH